MWWHMSITPAVRVTVNSETGKQNKINTQEVNQASRITLIQAIANSQTSGQRKEPSFRQYYRTDGFKKKKRGGLEFTKEKRTCSNKQIWFGLSYRKPSSKKKWTGNKSALTDKKPSFSSYINPLTICSRSRRKSLEEKINTLRPK